MARKPEGPEPGGLVWRAERDGARVSLYRATYVRRQGQFRYFADGRKDPPACEWRERGWHWWPSPEEALRAFIVYSWPFSKELRFLRLIFPDGAGEDEDFRAVVNACVLLKRVWDAQAKQRQETGGGRGEGEGVDHG